MFFGRLTLFRGLFASLLLFSTFHDSTAQTEMFPALNGEAPHREEGLATGREPSPDPNRDWIQPCFPRADLRVG